jgi:rhodanese-related sulfurtransferase
MVKRRLWMVIASAVCLMLAGCSQLVSPDANTPRITKEELKPLLGDPELIILDVRVAEDWKRSDSKIKGAIREDPEEDFKTWVSKYPKNKTIVFY